MTGFPIFSGHRRFKLFGYVLGLVVTGIAGSSVEAQPLPPVPPVVGVCVTSIPGNCPGGVATIPPGSATFIPAGAASFSSSGAGQFFQSSTQISNQVSQQSMAATQSEIRSIRDGLRRAPAATRRLPFAADPFNSSDEPFAYAAKQARAEKNPLYVKAPPPALISTTQFATWVQGFGDYEDRTGSFNGVDIGRTTRTIGVVGGIDVTTVGLTSASDAAVFGVLAGDTSANIKDHAGTGTARLVGPSVGLYAIYVNGGFSTDITSKVDFLGLDQTLIQAGTVSAFSFRLDNWMTAFNVNYKTEYERFWVEPTIGLTATRTIWFNAPQPEGRQLRVQGGARFGSSFDANGIHIEPTVTALLYSDVIIEGGVVAAAFAPPTDQGKIFGQLIGKLNFSNGTGFSSYVEGEVRGADSVFGVAGRAGLRYQWPASTTSAPAPAPMPVNMWTGFYGGGNLALLAGHTRTSGFGAILADVDSVGVLAGGQVGANYQVAEWVWGAEGEFDGADVGGGAGCNAPIPPGYRCEGRGRWLASATGRFGHIAWDRGLIYVKAGGAWAGVHRDFAAEAGNAEIAVANETISGWTVGAGVEYKLNRNWSAKLEYDYYEFPDHTVNFAVIPLPGTVVPVNLRDQLHVAKLGFNYAFNPAVAPVPTGMIYK